MKLICQKWEESERDPEFGVSVRPDGYSLHPSLLHLSRYVREYNDGLPTDHVPDVYSRPAGDPYECEISNNSLIPAAIENDGHFRSHANDYPEPTDGSKPTGWVNLPGGGQTRALSHSEQRTRDQLRALHPNIDKRLGIREDGRSMNRGKYIDDLLEAAKPALTEQQRKSISDNVEQHMNDDERRKIIEDADDLLASLPPPTQFPGGVNPEGMAEVAKALEAGVHKRNDLVTPRFDRKGERFFHLGVEDPPGGTLDIYCAWAIPVESAVSMTKAFADLMRAQKIPHLVVRLEAGPEVPSEKK